MNLGINFVKQDQGRILIPGLDIKLRAFIEQQYVWLNGQTKEENGGEGGTPDKTIRGNYIRWGKGEQMENPLC